MIFQHYITKNAMKFLKNPKRQSDFKLSVTSIYLFLYISI